MMQRNPYETPFQLEVERQQNLEKINQLKQTLEAAQQQEQQYKSQLERISHLKTSQLQEALQVAQQQELQYVSWLLGSKKYKHCAEFSKKRFLLYKLSLKKADVCLKTKGKTERKQGQ